MQAAVILLKTQVGLGVLAMPSLLQTTGAVPGIISEFNVAEELPPAAVAYQRLPTNHPPVIVGLGFLTTWCDYVVGTFKRNHPEVYSIADAGYIMFGNVGREVFAIGYWCFTVGVAGAAMVAISIGFNAVSDHATCTVVWVVLVRVFKGQKGAVWLTLQAATIAAAAASIQTLNRVSWIGWVGVCGIFTAVIMVTIAVGVQERPAAAPKTGPWDKDTHAFVKADIWDVVSVLSTLVSEYHVHVDLVHSTEPR